MDIASWVGTALRDRLRMEMAMRHRIGVVLGGVALVWVGLFAGGTGGAAASAPATASTPTPGPTLTFPPALPVSGSVTAVTERSLTVSYSMLLSPPCGYDPPVTVTLFATAEDARQWQNPLAQAVSAAERSGRVTIGGLTPDTTYWFRFSADSRRDPYVIGSGRTASVPACAAGMAIGSTWDGGFVATVTVRNVGTTAIDTWRVSWQWPGDERIVSSWNGVALGDTGTDVTIGNASYNGTLPPNGSTTFGVLVAAGTPPADLAVTCAR
jgi:Cellulose binding domain